MVLPLTKITDVPVALDVVRPLLGRIHHGIVEPQREEGGASGRQMVRWSNRRKADSRWRDAERGGSDLTIPRHKELDTGTLRAIYRQASRCVPSDELRG